MRSFENLDAKIGAVPSAVVVGLRDVDVCRGDRSSADRYPDLLASLADRARATSIPATAALDGVVVDDRTRAAAIVAARADPPRHHAEHELAGCREAFDLIDQGRWHPLDVDLLLHLHDVLLHGTGTPGGRLRQTENVVADPPFDLSDGVRVKRYVPVPVASTRTHLDELVARHQAARDSGAHHPVLLAGLFVLDLLAIHPFDEGNGRVARAVTHALLQDAGYDVTRYVSLEDRLLRSGDAYASALLDSTQDWHLARHDPWPWLAHLVRALAACSVELTTLTTAARTGGGKQQRVRDHVLHHARPRFRIAEVRAALPDVSDQTIRLVLARLRAEGLVEADGVGRGATWSRARRPAGR